MLNRREFFLVVWIIADKWNEKPSIFVPWMTISNLCHTRSICHVVQQWNGMYEGQLEPVCLIFCSGVYCWTIKLDCLISYNLFQYYIMQQNLKKKILLEILRKSYKTKSTFLLLLNFSSKLFCLFLLFTNFFYQWLLENKSFCCQLIGRE